MMNEQPGDSKLAEEQVSLHVGEQKNGARVEEFKPRNFTPQSKNKKPCWFYVNCGYCRYGRNCRYSHPRFSSRIFRYKNHNYQRSSNSADNAIQNNSPSRDVSTTHNDNVTIKSNNFNTSRDHRSPKRATSTSFNCDNVIVEKTVNSSTTSSRPFSDSVEQQERSQASRAEVKCSRTQGNNGTSLNPRQPLKLSLLSKDDFLNLRNTEISQLKKRCPKHDLQQMGNKDIISFTFSPSDPDWPFDLKSVLLEVSLHEDYPKEPCEIKILDDDGQMPPMLLKFLNRHVKEWVEERYQTCLSAGTTELVLRPFFRWFDRNMEQLFIEGLRKVKLDVEARKAGIEFVPYETLPGASMSSSSLPQNSQPNIEEQKENIIEQNNVPLSTENANLDNNESPSKENPNISPSTKEPDASDDIKCSVNSSSRNQSTTKKGTEVKLLKFELSEQASCLQFQKIAVTTRCTRCKTYNDITALSKQKNFEGSCSKCHQVQIAVYQPALLHPFSSVLGYLHLIGCEAIDLPLVQCQFVVDCLNCSKQNYNDGMHYGQTYSTWCLFCNQKLCASVQGVKFFQLQPAERIEKGLSDIHVTENRKKVRDPLIEVGKPLPDQGTCKHYKKSHRWLRFPCCGKVYACDLCHDENETDHEMKYASRMICGFCSKEQPYSKDRPCVSCSSALTRKSSTHWEGGKGCRDKVKMSREDKHKFSGVNKTTSRKVLAFQQRKKS